MNIDISQSWVFRAISIAWLVFLGVVLWYTLFRDRTTECRWYIAQSLSRAIGIRWHTVRIGSVQLELWRWMDGGDVLKLSTSPDQTIGYDLSVLWNRNESAALVLSNQLIASDAAPKWEGQRVVYAIDVDSSRVFSNASIVRAPEADENWLKAHGFANP